MDGLSDLQPNSTAPKVGWPFGPGLCALTKSWPHSPWWCLTTWHSSSHKHSAWKIPLFSSRVTVQRDVNDDSLDHEANSGWIMEPPNSKFILVIKRSHYSWCKSIQSRKINMPCTLIWSVPSYWSVPFHFQHLAVEKMYLSNPQSSKRKKWSLALPITTPDTSIQPFPTTDQHGRASFIAHTFTLPLTGIPHNFVSIHSCPVITWTLNSFKIETCMANMDDLSRRRSLTIQQRSQMTSTPSWPKINILLKI